MMAVFLKFIVLGEVPGLDVQLGYTESLIVAAVIILLTVLNFTFLYQHSRNLKRRLALLLKKDVELEAI